MSANLTAEQRAMIEQKRQAALRLRAEKMADTSVGPLATVLPTQAPAQPVQPPAGASSSIFMGQHPACGSWFVGSRCEAPVVSHTVERPPPVSAWTPQVRTATGPAPTNDVPVPAPILGFDSAQPSMSSAADRCGGSTEDGPRPPTSVPWTSLAPSQPSSGKRRCEDVQHFPDQQQECMAYVKILPRADHTLHCTGREPFAAPPYLLLHF